MEEPAFACMTKATRRGQDAARPGLRWAFARRERLRVYEDRLRCGDWVIPYESIRDARLIPYLSLLFLPGYVLSVRTEDGSYHFGLNGNAYWKGPLPFEVTREARSFHPGMAVVRVVFLVALFFWLRGLFGF